ncbi:putative sensor domain DACNV-containing protein [Parapedobacter pyrenivorans]|uniref:putative sensor domain DACNV-containing protein n=1 Tax=Parapedobacter pyrenivorans TaxID=1305674 RepID=UPI003342A2A0
MISEPTYLAAKIVSDRIAAHFEKQVGLHPDAERRHIPDIPVIETIIDTAFWASLRREEGYEPKISIAFAPPDMAGNSLVFHHTQRFSPHNLVKLSPAVLQPGIHLGVWMDDDNFHIWGTTYEVPLHCMVLEVVEAGLLVVKQKHSDRAGKFINIAVLKGNQIKIMDDNHWGLTDCPGILSALLGFSASSTTGESENILVQLALAMRSHGRGALLLVVPSSSSAWLHSIVKPINYLVNHHPALPSHADEGASDIAYSEMTAKMISAVGGYSAIDGATVITQDHRLLAFGAKVARSPHALPVAQLMITEPVAGSAMQLLDATNIGGTRHLAAAQFVNDQHDSLAMVASQDGTFTVFSWSEKQQLVHGHRIDTLLM